MNRHLSPATEPRHPEPLACSRCGRLMPDGDPERDEALVVSFRAGFWSIFGDESHVEGSRSTAQKHRSATRSRRGSALGNGEVFVSHRTIRGTRFPARRPCLSA